MDEEEIEEEKKTESNPQQPETVMSVPTIIRINADDKDIGNQVEIEDETAEFYKIAPKKPDPLVKQVTFESKPVPVKPKRKVEAPAPTQAEKKENPEEEPEDFQYTWNYIELARVFMEKKLAQLKEGEKVDEISKAMAFLAIIHVKLGDINYYQSHYKEALADYENCLNLRKFSEDPLYSRDIAEP